MERVRNRKKSEVSGTGDARAQAALRLAAALLNIAAMKPGMKEEDLVKIPEPNMPNTISTKRMKRLTQNMIDGGHWPFT